MIRVLAAGIAELRELQTAGGRLLVLRCRVVPVLALGALQCDNFAHLSILTDFAENHTSPQNPLYFEWRCRAGSRPVRRAHRHRVCWSKRSVERVCAYRQ